MELGVEEEEEEGVNSQSQHSPKMEKLKEAVIKLFISKQSHTQLSLSKTPIQSSLLQHKIKLIGDQIPSFYTSLRTTPTHPPYAEMVKEAIEELNEEGGSDLEAISKYIETNYEDLPWAHSHLLKHHLSKLVENGDIISSSDSCYILSNQNPKTKNELKQQKWKSRLRLRRAPEKRVQEEIFIAKANIIGLSSDEDDCLIEMGNNNKCGSEGNFVVGTELVRSLCVEDEEGLMELGNSSKCDSAGNAVVGTELMRLPCDGVEGLTQLDISSKCESEENAVVRTKLIRSLYDEDDGLMELGNYSDCETVRNFVVGTEIVQSLYDEDGSLMVMGDGNEREPIEEFVGTTEKIRLLCDEDDCLMEVGNNRKCESENLKKHDTVAKPYQYKNDNFMDGGSGEEGTEPECRGHGLGLNQVNIGDYIMPTPVCSSQPNTAETLSFAQHSPKMEKLKEAVIKLFISRQSTSQRSLSKTTIESSLLKQKIKLIEDHVPSFFTALSSTPTHLPYAVMVKEAIKELNEEGGSNLEAISNYIETNYEGLPWAHFHLLKHHLSKLVEISEIISSSDSGYLLPKPNTEKEHKQQRWKSRPRLGRAPEKYLPEEKIVATTEILELSSDEDDCLMELGNNSKCVSMGTELIRSLYDGVEGLMELGKSSICQSDGDVVVGTELVRSLCDEDEEGVMELGKSEIGDSTGNAVVGTELMRLSCDGVEGLMQLDIISNCESEGNAVVRTKLIRSLYDEDDGLMELGNNSDCETERNFVVGTEIVKSLYDEDGSLMVMGDGNELEPIEEFVGTTEKIGLLCDEDDCLMEVGNNRKRESENLNKHATVSKPYQWNEQGEGGEERMELEWRLCDLGLNQFNFGDSIVPTPVCFSQPHTTETISSAQHSPKMEKLKESVTKLFISRQSTSQPSLCKTTMESSLLKQKIKLIEDHVPSFFTALSSTPTHLPYAVMVKEAIKELNEEGGSNVEAISKYIETNCEGLPWAHSHLLKHHLSKLVEIGEIISSSDSCYLLPKPNTENEHKQQRWKSRPRLGRGPEKYVPEEEIVATTEIIELSSDEDDCLMELGNNSKSGSMGTELIRSMYDGVEGLMELGKSSICQSDGDAVVRTEPIRSLYDKDVLKKLGNFSDCENEGNFVVGTETAQSFSNQDGSLMVLGDSNELEPFEEFAGSSEMIRLFCDEDDFLMELVNIRKCESEDLNKHSTVAKPYQHKNKQSMDGGSGGVEGLMELGKSSICQSDGDAVVGIEAIRSLYGKNVLKKLCNFNNCENEGNFVVETETVQSFSNQDGSLMVLGDSNELEPFEEFAGSSEMIRLLCDEDDFLMELANIRKCESEDLNKHSTVAKPYQHKNKQSMDGVSGGVEGLMELGKSSICQSDGDAVVGTEAIRSLYGKDVLKKLGNFSDCENEGNFVVGTETVQSFSDQGSSLMVLGDSNELEPFEEFAGSSEMIRLLCDEDDFLMELANIRKCESEDLNKHSTVAKPYQHKNKQSMDGVSGGVEGLMELGKSSICQSDGDAVVGTEAIRSLYGKDVLKKLGNFSDCENEGNFVVGTETVQSFSDQGSSLMVLGDSNELEPFEEFAGSSEMIRLLCDEDDFLMELVNIRKCESEDLNKHSTVAKPYQHKNKQSMDGGSGEEWTGPECRGHNLCLNQVSFDDSTMPAHVYSCTAVGEQEGTKPEWRSHDLGLNQINFDNSTVPAPVCSCTGYLRQCYKWGKGGWQSACCSNTLSRYPLPVKAKKGRSQRVGRKMTCRTFDKLLIRLAAQGHDLSKPLDLKDHWARCRIARYSVPAPVCSCTGFLQQCYKWGKGGWQSSCCTTTLSMYPLPLMPNKRRSRLIGRKMSGSAFNKLLSQLSADSHEFHDLSTPLDLKDHWAKHGTKR